MRLPRLRSILVCAVVAAACGEPSGVAGEPARVLITNKPTDSLRTGDRLDFEGVVIDRSGHVTTSAPAIWLSRDSTVVQIDAETGGAVAIRPGITWVVAMAGAYRDSVRVKVIARVVTVRLSPVVTLHSVGRTVQLTAEALDATLLPISGRIVTWQVSNTAVLGGSNGNYTMKGAGETTVRATIDGRFDTVRFRVVQPVAWVTVTVPFDSAEVGTSGQALATAYHADGSVSTDFPLQWSAGLGTQVGPNGQFRVLAGGPASVQASADGVVGGRIIQGWYRFQRLGTNEFFVRCGITNNQFVACSASPVNGGSLGAFGLHLVTDSIRFAEISGGYTHWCGLSERGELYCWGSGGGGSSLGPVVQCTVFPCPLRPILPDSFTTIAAGGAYTCALKASHELYCWGAIPQWGQPRGLHQPAPAQRFKSVTAGHSYACAIDLDDRGWCWGDGHMGSGAGDTTTRSTPAPLTGPARWTMFALDGGTSCGLDIDGAAWCWGLHGLNAGTGAPDQCLEVNLVTLPCAWSPVAVPTALRFVSLTTWRGSFCGLTGTSEIWCWPRGWQTSITQTPNGGQTFTRFTSHRDNCLHGQAGDFWCWNNTSIPATAPARLLYQR